MTIKQYIEKHSLKLWKKWPDMKPDTITGGRGMISSSVPVVFIKPEQGEFERGNKFEIFSNPDRTHFVSINLSLGLFRVVHHDLIQIASPWEPTDRNYVIQGVMEGI